MELNVLPVAGSAAAAAAKASKKKKKSKHKKHKKDKRVADHAAATADAIGDMIRGDMLFLRRINPARGGTTAAGPWAAACWPPAS